MILVGVVLEKSTKNAIIRINLIRMRPHLSVIIPTLNEEEYLPLLLKNLVEQTYSSFDVIVVDGQSEDNTKQVAQSFSSSLSLSFQTRKKRNISYQRNYGAHVSKADYLIFLDADAHVNENFLERIAEAIEQTPYLIYIPVRVPEKSNYEDAAMLNTINFLIEVSQYTDKPFTYSSCAIFERHTFAFLKGYKEDVTFYEDHEIIQRARSQGILAKLLKDVQVQFSTRRYDQEGRLKVLQRYLVATAHMYLRGEITENIFDDLEMGGKPYEKKSETIDARMRNVMDDIKQYMDDIFRVR